MREGRETHAKLITDCHPCKAAWDPPPAPHPPRHTSFSPFIFPVTSVVTQLRPRHSPSKPCRFPLCNNNHPNKAHHKNNRSPQAVRRWCKQIRCLGEIEERVGSKEVSMFRMITVTSLPSRSFNPLQKCRFLIGNCEIGYTYQVAEALKACRYVDRGHYILDSQLWITCITLLLQHKTDLICCNTLEWNSSSLTHHRDSRTAEKQEGWSNNLTLILYFFMGLSRGQNKIMFFYTKLFKG